MFPGNLNALRTPEYEVRQIHQNLGLSTVMEPRQLDPGELTLANVLFTDDGWKQAPAFRLNNGADTWLGDAGTKLWQCFELGGTEWDVYRYSNGNTWIRRDHNDELKLPSGLSATGFQKISWCRNSTSSTSAVDSYEAVDGGDQYVEQDPGTFTTDEFAGGKIKFTSGAAAGGTFFISSNTDSRINVGDASMPVAAAGDTYELYHPVVSGGDTYVKSKDGAFVSGEYAGKIIKVMSGNNAGAQFMVTTNTDSTIYIDGRFNSPMAAGDTYAIYTVVHAIFLHCEGNSGLYVLANNVASVVPQFSGIALNHVCGHRGRVFVATKSVPAKIRFSSSGAGYFPDQNNMTIPGASSVSMESSDDRLVIFTPEGRHYLYGSSPDDFQLVPGGRESSMRFQRSHAYAAGTVYFVSDNGVESVAALDAAGIGEAKPYSYPITRPGSTSIFGNSSAYGLALNQRFIRMAYGDNRLWVFVNKESDNTCVAYVLDMPLTTAKGRPVWSAIQIPSQVSFAAYDDVNQRIVVCIRNCAFFLDESRTDSEGISLPAPSVRSGVLNFGDVSRPQNVYKVRYTLRVKGTVSGTITAYDEYGATIRSQAFSASSASPKVVRAEMFVNRRIAGAAFAIDIPSLSSGAVVESELLETFTTPQPKPK